MSCFTRMCASPCSSGSKWLLRSLAPLVFQVYKINAILSGTMFIDGKLVSWKSKKQDTVVRSSVKVEYRAMVSAACERLWLKQLTKEPQCGDVG